MEICHPKAATTLEKKFLGKLEKLEVSNDKESTWCFRRMGYTENENPSHTGIIIDARGSSPIGPFSCSSLAPTSTDILKALAHSASSSVSEGKMPVNVLIDDLACCERIQYLFREHPIGSGNLEGGIQAAYYPPPTREETAAAMAMR
jgi:hypothetical protein